MEYDVNNIEFIQCHQHRLYYGNVLSMTINKITREPI